MSWREEPWWHWDWPGRPEQQLRSGGDVRVMNDAPPSGPPAACLYVPDPSERTGWRNWWVYRDPPQQQKPPMGFK